MLKTASLVDSSSRLITKRQGHLVVTTRFYPRGLSKSAIHEYISLLSPTKLLLQDFKSTAKKTGHNSAFGYVRYTERFELSPEGMAELKRLSELGQLKDVYLICHCTHAQLCHRDLLLLMAQAHFNAPIERVQHRYPGFDPLHV